MGADAKINAPILRHGIVKVANLPVEFVVPESEGNFTFIGGSSDGGSGNP